MVPAAHAPSDSSRLSCLVTAPPPPDTDPVRCEAGLVGGEHIVSGLLDFDPSAAQCIEAPESDGTACETSCISSACTAGT